MCNMFSTSKQGMKIHVQRAINMDCAKNISRYWQAYVSNSCANCK